MKTYAYGYPRLGPKREFKKIVEQYLDEHDEEELDRSLDAHQQSIIETYRQFVDFFPIGEMTLYDNLLDAAIMVGLYRPGDRREYFELCRGKNALPMMKWFNTNYHYLVPDFTDHLDRGFTLNWAKARDSYNRFRQGIPWVIGPLTLVKLSRGIPEKRFSDTLLEVGDIYRQLAMDLPELQIDEPGFVLELTPMEIDAVRQVYTLLGSGTCPIHLMTYYDSVDCLDVLFDLPVQSIGLDLVHGRDTLKKIMDQGFPADKTLIAGIVDGRNIWRTDLRESESLLRQLANRASRMMISNAAPLYHLPVTTEGESLDPRLLHKLAFARERLRELRMLAAAIDGGDLPDWRDESSFGGDVEVSGRVSGLKSGDFQRSLPYAERCWRQRIAIPLPAFPATTIGSFPQTSEIRRARSRFKSGKSTREEYDSFVRTQIKELIEFQESLDLDVLVHGEFERSDMVEFFAEKMKGVATTDNGWILSYGTRGYRPPIIFGDVTRAESMTVSEIVYAQSLTEKPVKGMLTGAVTIIAWSFVREDIPLSEVAFQISLALQDEISELEDKSIRIIQIDEPAFREKAPIKKRLWPEYFSWAIKSFRLATAKCRPETMIQTHMCYSEFGEIIDQILAMDFDVILIEGTRSKGTILESFEKAGFDRQIGLGVWDIHSPAIPTLDQMQSITDRALALIGSDHFWINPDCGLKTRDWPETRESLAVMMKFCRRMRGEFAD